MIDFDINAIRKIPNFNSIYHEDFISQHYQYYFYLKARNIEEAINYDKNNYLPLNNANLLLGRFCKNLINRIEYDDESKINDSNLTDILNKWQTTFKTGAVFDTFKYVSTIFKMLKEINYPLDVEIRNSSDLLEGFLTVPSSIKSFVQTALLIPEENLMSFFDRIINYLYLNNDVCKYIKEFKVSKSLELHSIERIRNIKIVFDPFLITNPQNLIVKELINELKLLTVQKDLNRLNLEKFSLKICDNLYVSQGNIQYKEFLSLLGIISDVYDYATNYAYTL